MAMTTQALATSGAVGLQRFEAVPMLFPRREEDGVSDAKEERLPRSLNKGWKSFDQTET